MFGFPHFVTIYVIVLLSFLSFNGLSWASRPSASMVGGRGEWSLLQPTTRRHSWCFGFTFGVLTLSLLCSLVSTANDYGRIVCYIKILFCYFHFIWAKSETRSVSVAAKKTKKQVYVSYSLPVTDSNISLLVEDRIKKELELHPEHFWTCLFLPLVRLRTRMASCYPSITVTMKTQ